MLLNNPDQSPTLDTAEKIAVEIGTTLSAMIAPPTDDQMRAELISGFSRLDDRGRAQVLALIRADLSQIDGAE